jgi:hypothetical protein
MISFWPTWRMEPDLRLFAAARSAFVSWFFFAIVESVSPRLTVYVVAGVTSETGCVSSAEATVVPGRVGL